MSYNTIQYIAFFLPVVILLYQIVPANRRWIILLGADAVFFTLLSSGLVLYIVISILLTHYIGIWMEDTALTGKERQIPGKQTRKVKSHILLFGVLIQLSVLIALKYSGFFLLNISEAFRAIGWNVNYQNQKWAIPIGISYYTLQSISYMADVNSGKIQAERNIAKIALYMSFFPTILEGPITRFADVSEALYAGKTISYENLTDGYQHILWGLFKKMVVADHIAPVVNVIFTQHTDNGAICLVGAIAYTIQLYADFSGTIDIVIGSGKIFGVKIAENFRQPFFARNAGDFWRRWHITLGTWFRDYIFYPVSLSKSMTKLAKQSKQHLGVKASRFVVPSIALMCVWLSNGLWHGPKWNYILYGCYYFVLIFSENLLEKPLEELSHRFHFSLDKGGFRIFRAVKLFVIVIMGEMLFRADTIGVAGNMLTSILFRFHIRDFTRISWMHGYGVSRSDIAVIVIGIVVIAVVDILNERGISVREQLGKYPLPLRWTVSYGAILCIIIFGAYGAGYDATAMIYAGF